MSDHPTLDDLKDDGLPDASIEDRLSDDELHKLLTNVFVHVRSVDEPTEAGRIRIAGEVRAVVDAAVKRRNDAEAKC